MTDKKSLVDIVAEKIQSNPYIQFCLADGLINYSALARHYLPEIEKSEGRPVNEESVMVAIKRYSEKVNFTPAKLNYAEIFSQVSVGMHEDMAFGVFEKTDKVIEEMTRLFREEKWEVGEIRTVMEEPLTITALVKKSKLDRLCEKIEGKLIKVYRDFSMVTMKFAKSGDRIYGKIARSIRGNKGNNQIIPKNNTREMKLASESACTILIKKILTTTSIFSFDKNGSRQCKTKERNNILNR